MTPGGEEHRDMAMPCGLVASGETLLENRRPGDTFIRDLVARALGGPADESGARAPS